MSDVQQRIDSIVKGGRVVLFMKGTAQFPQCGFSGRAIQVLKASGVTELKTVNVLEDDEIRQGIKDYANWPTIPQLYVKGEFVGGCDIVTEMTLSGELDQLLEAKGVTITENHKSGLAMQSSGSKAVIDDSRPGRRPHHLHRRLGGDRRC